MAKILEFLVLSSWVSGFFCLEFSWVFMKMSKRQACIIGRLPARIVSVHGWIPPPFASVWAHRVEIVEGGVVSPGRVERDKLPRINAIRKRSRFCLQGRLDVLQVTHNIPELIGSRLSNWPLVKGSPVKESMNCTLNLFLLCYQNRTLASATPLRSWTSVGQLLKKSLTAAGLKAPPLRNACLRATSCNPKGTPRTLPHCHPCHWLSNSLREVV